MVRVSTVSDGVVNRTSPSALQRADDCLRKWWYRYVMKIEEPQGAGAKLGSEIHEQIEHYLKTGEQALGAIVMSAKPFIPAPNPELQIEHTVKIADNFTVEGIPLYMKLDLVNPTGFYIDPMMAIRKELPGVVEVVDWKSTSNLKYTKSGTQLLDTIQMIVYGKYIVDMYEADAARLSHVYMLTKGRPRSEKSTIVAGAEDLELRWPRIEGIARTIKDVAKESDVNKIPANLSMCSQYGGCFYRDRCPKTREQTISQIFGGALSMSFLPPSTPEVDAAEAKLLAREAEAKKPPEVPADFRQAVEFVRGAGMGFPTLTHEAYQLFCIMEGHEYKKGSAWAGSGRAGGAQITTAANMIGLAKEVAQATGKTFPPDEVEAPVPVLPPDAPESNPALAAEPVEGFSVVQPGESVTVSIPLEKPAEPEVKAEAEAEEEPSPGILTPEECSRLNRKALRMAEYAKLYEAFKALESGAPAPAPQAAVTTGPQAGIYLNCVVPGAEPLEPYVEACCERICKEFGINDIRLGPNDGPLGFGRWKGALAAFVRANPPKPGVYTLQVYNSELRGVVAEALQGNVVAQGVGR